VATVGERYQIVIERDARAQLGVQPGDRAIETVERGRLVVTFVPGRHRRSLRGRLASQGEVEDFAEHRDGGELADRLASEHRGGR
jgi:bifunctional DNA-binding transcriptional regulator/antitoxin component of YhaV-PrlF toxin-antitoxin module